MTDESSILFYLTVGEPETSLTCRVICKTKATVRHFGALEKKINLGTPSNKGRLAKQTCVPWSRNYKRGLLAKSMWRLFILGELQIS